MKTPRHAGQRATPFRRPVLSIVAPQAGQTHADLILGHSTPPIGWHGSRWGAASRARRRAAGPRRDGAMVAHDAPEPQATNRERAGGGPRTRPGGGSRGPPGGRSPRAPSPRGIPLRTRLAPRRLDLVSAWLAQTHVRRARSDQQVPPTAPDRPLRTWPKAALSVPRVPGRRRPAIAPLRRQMIESSRRLDRARHAAARAGGRLQLDRARHRRLRGTRHPAAQAARHSPPPTARPGRATGGAGCQRARRPAHSSTRLRGTRHPAAARPSPPGGAGCAALATWRPRGTRHPAAQAVSERGGPASGQSWSASTARTWAQRTDARAAPAAPVWTRSTPASPSRKRGSTTTPVST